MPGISKIILLFLVAGSVVLTLANDVRGDETLRLRRVMLSTGGEKCGRGMPRWRKIWGNGLPVTANSPKSGHRKATEGKLLQRRRNLDMIAMDLKAIWEMSVECIRKNS